MSQNETRGARRFVHFGVQRILAGKGQTNPRTFPASPRAVRLKEAVYLWFSIAKSDRHNHLGRIPANGPQGPTASGNSRSRLSSTIRAPSLQREVRLRPPLARGAEGDAFAIARSHEAATCSRP